MIYIVKCFYCEHEFKVKRGETGADMMCPECGHANSIKDVIQRIEEESDKVDSDLQAIKGFDMDEHPVSHNAEWKSAESRRWDSIIRIGFLLTALILYLLHKSGLVDVLALMDKLDGLFE